MCLKVSQCWNICSLTHTKKKRSTLWTNTFWASPYGFSSSVGSVLGAVGDVWQLSCVIFLHAHQFDPNGWTAGISPSWRRLLTGVHFSGRLYAVILLNGALLFSFLFAWWKEYWSSTRGSLLSLAIHFIVKSILLYFKTFREDMTNKFSCGHILIVLVFLLWKWK